LRALIVLARQRGVEIIEDRRVTAAEQTESRVAVVTGHGEEIACERAMIASGPWTRKLLPLLSDGLTTTRQEIVYFKPADAAATGGAPGGGQSFEPASFPIFLELESGFYGFPIHYGGAMKIANHHKGPVVDPSSMDDRVDDQFIERCRAFFAEFIPGLADARVHETRVCVYNNTPDDDFIIDWHPQLERVLVVTGFSGHGFKFGPTIGCIAAQLLLSRRTSYDIDRFRLDRLKGIGR
jgi:glycine/D-amino acid oxidase-like deaminating enzyme